MLQNGILKWFVKAKMHNEPLHRFVGCLEKIKRGRKKLRKDG